MIRFCVAARLVFVFMVFVLASCSSKKKDTDTAALRRESAVVAIGSDVDFLNPLLIQLSISREICMLIFPKLVQADYDDARGEVIFTPSLASRWTFSADGKTATFFLKPDAKWQDGKPITASDLKFSYALYANPIVASTRQHYLDDLLRTADGSLDAARAIETPNDTTLVLHFRRPLAPRIVLDHFHDLMPVAKHIFETIDPKDIRAKAPETPVISGGAFKVEKWERQREIVLASNETSVLPHPAVLKKLFFRIIPEYTTRLTAFKAGEADVFIAGGGISPKDAVQVAAQNPLLKILSVKNRYFDSVVWLTIDGDAFRTNGTIKPNPFFGDKRVRQAMTLAINRTAIVDGFMGNSKATIVNTPLSPAFKAFANPALDAYDYNPSKAKTLLKESGWTTGNDGILQKNGKKFSITLTGPAGNARRNYAATIIQQNLKEVGIDCKVVQSETVMFNQNQNDFKLDAALSGLAAETMPFLLTLWDSDFKKSPFNSAAFQSKRLDEVCLALGSPQSGADELKLWHEYQTILHDEQPRTFLYYYDELEGFNSRIENVKVSMLAVLLTAADWRIAP
jgi:peptide/nickel transport system substrate-binding protein